MGRLETNMNLIYPIKIKQGEHLQVNEGSMNPFPKFIQVRIINCSPLELLVNACRFAEAFLGLPPLYEGLTFFGLKYDNFFWGQLMNIHCNTAAAPDPRPAVVGWYTPAVQVSCLG
jgi:hypothetical protein